MTCVFSIKAECGDESPETIDFLYSNGLGWLPSAVPLFSSEFSGEAELRGDYDGLKDEFRLTLRVGGDSFTRRYFLRGRALTWVLPDFVSVLDTFWFSEFEVKRGAWADQLREACVDDIFGVDEGTFATQGDVLLGRSAESGDRLAEFLLECNRYADGSPADCVYYLDGLVTTWLEKRLHATDAA